MLVNICSYSYGRQQRISRCSCHHHHLQCTGHGVQCRQCRGLAAGLPPPDNRHVIQPPLPITITSSHTRQWCPIPDYTAFVACGTYQLVPATEAGEGGDGDDEPAAASSGQKNKRVGRLLLLRHDTDPEPARGGSLQLLQTIDLPAILDMKWLVGLVGPCIDIGLPTTVYHSNPLRQVVQWRTGSASCPRVWRDCTLSPARRRAERGSLSLARITHP